VDAEERRAWLFPPVVGRFRELDLGLLDPADDDERRILIEAEHPELADALARDLDEVVLHGETVSPRLHVAMHEVVASQLWHDDPPEMWATAERLLVRGHDRHEVLHMLGSVVAAELWHIARGGEPFDRERQAAALAALPGSWEEPDDDEEYDDQLPGAVLLPDGTTVTHRLIEAEAAGGFVAYGPDLEPLGPLLADHGHLHLAGGEVAEPDIEDDRQVLVGPAGWLGEVGAGELIGFRIAGEEVEVARVDAPGAIVGLGDRLRAAFDDLNGGDGMPVPVTELLATALAERSGLEPVVLPPLGELLPSCGFELRGGHAAPEGADWETFGRIQAAAAVAVRHGLDGDSPHALVMLSELYRLVVDGRVRLDDDQGGAAEVASMLADPDPGRAFVDMARTLSDDDELRRFLEEVLRGAARRDRAGVTWTMSVAAAGAGDHARAEALLRRALEADPDHREALEDAAWYASDRGDARRAMEVLRRLWQLGEDEADQRAAVLARYASPSAAAARRNDPCPCGSGRKHKHCCQRVATAAPLAERVRWIWEKLDWFLSRSGFDDELDEVMAALGGYEPEHEMLAASLVLFRDGAVDAFLGQRAPVLPDDEGNLVAQWALVERSVHEVVAVDRGIGMTVRDIRTGEVVEVREGLASTQVAVGDLVFAHVVPDGVGHQIVGGVVPVRLQLRDPLVALLDGEADAVEVASLLATAAAPPEVLNVEGEPVVVCEARYEVGDPSALAALDEVLDRDDEHRWSESVEVDGRTWVRGSATVDGPELVVTANSEARFRRLRRLVESAVPGLQLVSETTAPAADVIAARGEGAPLPPPQPLPAETADAVAAFLREQEDRWVDERIPALGGLTPRQAAADPTRREQLEALLHEFDRHPPPPGALTFDTGRIRAALNLEG